MSTQIGLLYNEQNIKLQRKYFNDMLRMIGIEVQHYAMRPNKHYTNYAELALNFEPPVTTGCVFEEHPTQKTMKKLGWNSERQENESVISVPYDLSHLEVGSLFMLPSGIDNTPGRLFRVVEMSNIMLYPASITCKLVPEFESTSPSAHVDYKTHDFALLRGEQ